MTDDAPAPAEDADIPRGQRLFDNPWLLLAVGLLVMLVFYTAWGLWEVSALPPAPLP
jgi:hypothetical protein